jgi:hypothetical protein
MKNNGLLLVLLAAAAYFLTQKKTGATPPKSGGNAECMNFGEATAYMAVAWLRAGRLPSNMPNLGDFIPTSGAACITRDYIDNIVRESL